MVHPIAEANESSPFGDLSASEFYTRHSVSHSSEFITNSRGLKLFTQQWAPSTTSTTLSPSLSLIGVIFMIHGFTSESSRAVQLTAVHFAKSGFIVCAMDHQGHGFSEGLSAHIPNVNDVVDDCISFFESFREAHAPPYLPSFLYGESLGGAIALHITLRRRRVGRGIDGVVLSGAMCGISKMFWPWFAPPSFEPLLALAAAFIPTWPVAFTRAPISDVTYKLKWKTKMERGGPNTYRGTPRAATAYELVRVCKKLRQKFEQVDVPLLIVHGGDDVMCDPASVEDLYRQASSKDKTLKIYPNMWHMLVGEPDDNVELVFGDVLEWFKTRALSIKAKQFAFISK